MSQLNAIVCGGSFAGLAAAGQIGGRVLVIDSQEVGDGETSASAVPLACLERLDLLGCVQQVHRDLVLHTRRASHRARRSRRCRQRRCDVPITRRQPLFRPEGSPAL